ncbi:hypothetical protein K4A83_06660 [Spirulina subsalsa FACHB-351]|uniref:Lipase n=1 Tax=Spirulina subsalsa FACHB-351 TaxID=234711 RepID=A0ABT3L372_9CYAN|nr:lipase family protein [Spirulina subsalsa]MCW6035953.1 hypothetical protein [Spirulina subsalsa FACHB-351]
MKALRWILGLFVLGYGLGCQAASPPPPTAQENPHHTPILFVHGLGLNASTWNNAIAHFQAQGYPSSYLLALDIKPNDEINITAAEKFIAPAIESLLQQAAQTARQAGIDPPQKVDIIAHSMGAVSTRWYIAKMRPERVRTWIAVAGANYGTNALCPYPGPANQEMCPAFATSQSDSFVQIALNGTPSTPTDPSPYSIGTNPPNLPSTPPDRERCIAYFTLRIDPDRWIKPEDSAQLPGSGMPNLQLPSHFPAQETSPGNYLFQKPVDHDPLPQDPDFLQLASYLIEQVDQNLDSLCP